MTETSYRVVREFVGHNKKYQDGFSLVELEPKTGRTHQIRVVLKHLGLPIVSDATYVGRKRYKTDIVWCHRQFLHAKKLCFEHPVSRQILCFESPLSNDLSETLANLEEDEVQVVGKKGFN